MSLKSVSEEWLNCDPIWNSAEALFEISTINWCVEFSIIFFGTAKEDCVIKAREMFSFSPLIKNSVTTGLRFLLLNISVFI